MKKRYGALDHFRGFTLMELLVVIIIMSVLVAIAVPTYINTKEKALDKEAVTALKMVKAGERQYFSKFEFFYPVSGSTSNLAFINDNLSLDLSGSNWGYAISGTGSTFSATAARGARTWTITQVTSDPTCSPVGSCL
ncbi:MAG: prepilin-type N-terminal cleavage/methylation domain-containing protein [Candidatus Omnitrophica bacterium]|nr:prepilin-type N-terminal cleavage/methylation domain-containing protein [Candidatus Omnitrophota bacterium]